MLRRYWRTLATIGLGVVVAASVGLYLFLEAGRLQSTYENQASQYAEKYHDATHVNIQRRCALVTGNRLANCRAEQREAAREGERKEYDLQAQLVTSAWTRTMGIAAIIGMTVGIFGLGLIYTTFREARRSADASEKTYKAFVDVERARLVAAPAHVGVVSTKHGLLWQLELGISNIGRSSAAIIQARYDLLEGVDFPPVFAIWTAINSALEPSDDRVVRLYFEPKQIADKPFIGGYVEYRTTLGNTHHSYFLVAVQAVEGPKQYELVSHPYTNPQARKRFGWPDDD